MGTSQHGAVDLNLYGLTINRKLRRCLSIPATMPGTPAIDSKKMIRSSHCLSSNTYPPFRSSSTDSFSEGRSLWRYPVTKSNPHLNIESVSPKTTVSRLERDRDVPRKMDHPASDPVSDCFRRPPNNFDRVHFLYWSQRQRLTSPEQYVMKETLTCSV